LILDALQNVLRRCSSLLLSGNKGENPVEEAKKSNHVQRKIKKRQKDRKLDPH
ncbi:hypothetical protein HN873_060646, partial [Arachis hypogaea]